MGLISNFQHDRSRDIIACIDLGKIKHNLSVLKEQSGGKPVWAVLKANAYGHGAVEIAQSIKDRAYGFAVSTLDEALELRTAGLDNDILVLGGVKPEGWPIASLLNLSIALVSPDNLSELVLFLKNNQLKIHLKIDTGMGRLGFLKSDVSLHQESLKLMKNSIVGLMSHFSSADEPSRSFMDQQISAFHGIRATLRDFDIQPSQIHFSNTDALQHGAIDSETHTRPGLGLFGLSNHPQNISLNPCLDLICNILRVKSVPEGTAVGYGRTYITPSPMQIVTLACGYADGYLRAFGNHVSVSIEGNLYPVVGRVSMDFTTIAVPINVSVDITKPVYLISSDPNSPLSLRSLSHLAHVLPYEITCGLQRRITRVYKD
ncbi:alanine racemase [Acidobacteriota bacterium]|nr:alanine racemase [Acidobacteriota bacterium]